MAEIKFTKYPDGWVASKRVVGGFLTGIGKTKKDATKDIRFAEKKMHRYQKLMGVA